MKKIYQYFEHNKKQSNLAINNNNHDKELKIKLIIYLFVIAGRL